MSPFPRNKKSGLISVLMETILISIAFIGIAFVIMTIFKGEADAESAKAICRLSVAAREKTHIQIREKRTGVELASGASPLLCRTIPKNIPENKYATKQRIEKELADLMASCWKIFGEGRIKDVFKQGDSYTKNCFVCYNVNLRETSNFKGDGGKISPTELREYLFTNPYIAYGYGDDCKSNGGFCTDAEKSSDCASQIAAQPPYLLIDKKNDVCKAKGKKSCCYTEYECWNRGGICSLENPDTTNIVYKLYNDWDCPRVNGERMNCYVKTEDYLSYGDYIQNYGGEGNILIKTPTIQPGETYSISFGSPTEKCSWCDEAAKGGAKGGAVAGIGTVLVLIAQGGATAAIAANPLGATLIVGTWVVGGYFVTKGTTEITNDMATKLLEERKINTIYFTTLNDMQQGNHCAVVKDIRQK